MIFMEEPEVFNLTDRIMPLARPHSYPTSLFPAWLPAVTVAVSMILFLAGSFYLRHRKVMKKRQILMDYFYIIFQYGGTRRKRMVTALCNTNAITLRELGRSFMISCESMPGNDNDNSCPFYLDDSPYSRPRGNLRRPLSKKYSILKRGFTITKKNRGPFLRFKTQSEENNRQYPHSFQDIVMKLGGRRHHEDSSRSRTSHRQALVTPQFEGCSMSTIHGDEMEYETAKQDYETSDYYNRQRRNAYILQYDKTTPRFADVATEVARHSLGHVVPDRLNTQHSPYPGKRNSEPWQHMHEQNSETRGLQPDVFHVQGGHLSPSKFVCGSHGYISSIDKENNAYQPYRNSEPTILVHSPSMEGDASQGWNDSRSKYTNGVVFLKRVSKEDGSPGEYYYEEARTPSVDRPVRTSLSKVSYVPSGNMNRYQNCILSPNKDKTSTEEEIVSKKPKGENTSQGMSKTKRGRLNLGRMGVGNFSRRIDMASDSVQDYEPENSSENKSSSENVHQQRTSPRTTWTRFKNVFSGSRDAQNASAQIKTAASLPISEQQRVRTREERTNWQRFLSVFTGFRSFPESNKEDDLVDLPKSSNSFPLGLNFIGNNCDANFVDIEVGTKILPYETGKQSSPESSKCATLSAASSFSDNGRSSSIEDSSIVCPADHQRPTSLNLNSRTQSFPDEIIHRRQYLQRFQRVFDANGLVKNKPFQNRPMNQRYGKLSNYFAPHAAPLSKCKRDFKSYSFEAGYFSPGGEYRFKGCPTFMDSPHAATPDRLEGNSSGSEMSVCPRRFRSLSPLLEINCTDSNKGACNDRTSNLESVPSCSVYMTPFEKSSNVQNYGTELKACEKMLIPDALALEQVYTYSITERQDFLPINSITERQDFLPINSITERQDFLPINSITERQDVLPINSITERQDFLPINSITERQDFLPINSITERQDFLPINSDSSPDIYDDEHIVNIDEFKYLESHIKELDCLQLDYSDACLQTNTIVGSNDKLPQPCFLKPNHKNVSRSTDSVYYDTVSALGTPSPCDPRETDFAKISLTEHTWGNADTGLINAFDTDTCDLISPSSHDAIVSPNVLDKQTSAATEPPTTSPGKVPFSLQSALLSSESQASLDLQCNDHTDSHASQGADSIKETTVDNISRPPAPNVEFSSTQSIQRSVTERHYRSPLIPLSFDESQFENLPVPVRKSNNNDHQNTSSDASPKSSRSSTPTRRHSNPSPSPERSQYRPSGCCTPDEIYRANVTRLPRMSQRLGHSGTMPSLCTVKYIHE